MEIKDLFEIIKILFEAINKILRRLNNLRRWSGSLTEGRYDEIAKQALNCIICFFLATEVENAGYNVKWERFPKIAISRAFQKAYVNYDTPERILKEICEMGKIPYEETFKKVTFQIISEHTNKDVAEWLSEGEATMEERIYKAATKVATLIELNEIQKHINGEYTTKYQEIINSMNEFSDIPCFKNLSDSRSGYFKVFRDFSKLRNQNRWAAYSYNVECSVLGHLFDTAIFAYLMAIEKGKKEKEASKYFFMGIFHDVPEAFTHDIPSPIKDKIPGFRSLTEAYELKMMQEKVYPYVSECVKKALKEVMLEEAENKEFKALLKGADYLSAASEIYRQFTDKSFEVAMRRHGDQFSNNSKVEITEGAMQLFEKMLKDMTEK